MTFSPLTHHSVPTNNYSSRQGRRISRLIIHYTAGGTDSSNLQLLSRSQDYGRQVSATYLLQRNGHLIGIVPEEHRPWTSGGFDADAPSITVETVMAAQGKATKAQMETLAQLAADLSTRYNWGTLTRSNVRGHREFANTRCPGPYLWDRLTQIIDRGNKIRVQRPQSTKPDDIDVLAAAVLRGDYGNGNERKRRLGANYAAVQQRVNKKLGL